MGRPRLPVGAHGRIKRTQIADSHDGKPRWQALCRVRDSDGVTRKVFRYTPDGVTDRTGAAAERALMQALTERHHTPDVSGDMRLTDLWTMYRKQLADDGKAASTLGTYDSVAKRITEGIGQLRIREARTQQVDAHIRAVNQHHGAATARKVRVLLFGMFSMAVRFGAITDNPVRDVSTIVAPRKPQVRSLDTTELAQLLQDVHHSAAPCGGMTVADFCHRYDLADVVTLFAGTGCRMGELVGVRWEDVDLDAGTLTVTGKISRQTGVGLVRDDFTKTAAGQRTLPLPRFAVAMLTARATTADGSMVFDGATGFRNPDTVWAQWRKVRAALYLEWVTPHVFRKTVATILDDEGLTARQAADQLGHAKVSMTSDVYFGRGRTHAAAAVALDGAMTKRPVSGLPDAPNGTDTDSEQG